MENSCFSMMCDRETPNYSKLDRYKVNQRPLHYTSFEHTRLFTENNNFFLNSMKRSKKSFPHSYTCYSYPKYK